MKFYPSIIFATLVFISFSQAVNAQSLDASPIMTSGSESLASRSWINNAISSVSNIAKVVAENTGKFAQDAVNSVKNGTKSAKMGIRNGINSIRKSLNSTIQGVRGG